MALAVLVVGRDGELRFASMRACALLDCVDATLLRERWPSIAPQLRLDALPSLAVDEPLHLVVEFAAQHGVRRLRLEILALQHSGQASNNCVVLLEDPARLDAIASCIVDKSRLQALPDRAAMLAHELSGPLHNIAITAELLAKALSAESADQTHHAKQLQTLRAETSRAREQLQALPARLEMAFERHSYDLAPVLGTVLRALAYRGAARGIKVAWGTDAPAGAVMLQGSPALVAHALLGVGGSLLAHSSRGGELSLGLSSDERVARVTLEAASAVVPAPYLAALHDSGLCALAAYESSAGAAGEARIAWTAARLIVESQGGTIELLAAPGCAVELRLPLQPTA